MDFLWYRKQRVAIGQSCFSQYWRKTKRYVVQKEKLTEKKLISHKFWDHVISKNRLRKSSETPKKPTAVCSLFGWTIQSIHRANCNIDFLSDWFLSSWCVSFPNSHNSNSQQQELDTWSSNKQHFNKNLFRCSDQQS